MLLWGFWFKNVTHKEKIIFYALGCCDYHFIHGTLYLNTFEVNQFSWLNSSKLAESKRTTADIFLLKTSSLIPLHARLLDEDSTKKIAPEDILFLKVLSRHDNSCQESEENYY